MSVAWSSDLFLEHIEYLDLLQVNIMIIYIKKNILYDLIWMNVRAKSQVIVTEAIKIFILCHWKESNSFMKLWGI